MGHDLSLTLDFAIRSAAEAIVWCVVCSVWFVWCVVCSRVVVEALIPRPDLPLLGRRHGSRQSAGFNAPCGARTHDLWLIRPSL